MRPLRTYADTSIFGGAFDQEFRQHSVAFFEQVRSGLIRLVVSPVVEEEIIDAPREVRDFFDELAPFIDRAEIGVDAYDLQQAYLRAEVVSEKWKSDALHVAVATVSGCRVIASWNFKHMVNFRRISLYNSVNLAQGYGAISIHTPQEVPLDGD